MGKASRTKQAPDRRAKIAAQQAAERRRKQIQRIYWAGGSIIAVVAVVLAFVLISQNHSGQAAAGSTAPTGAALTKLTSQVTGIPTSVTDKIGGGSVNTSQFVPGSQLTSAAQNLGSFMATVNGKALTANGKPEVLYLGAEYCPYCAAERWSMINALSRFGTFSNLSGSHSSTTDSFPNTSTFSFYKSSYSSKYVTFTPVEETANYRQGNSSDTNTPYVTLQNPTSAQAQIGQAYDPSGSIPFIDLGNKYVEVGNLSPWGPSLIQGKTWTQIATALADPKSSISTAAIGNANYLTAGICSLTNNQPATACTPAIQTLEGAFAK